MDRSACVALGLSERGLGPSCRTAFVIGLAGRQLLEYPGGEPARGADRLRAGDLVLRQHYVIPEVISRPGTVIAVNVGGALIPGLLSVLLYIRNRLWISAIIATVVVAGVCHWLA